MFIEWITNASWRNSKLTVIEPLGFDAATYAKYWITFLVFSVLPAPDSPVQRMDWSSRSVKKCKKKVSNNKIVKMQSRRRWKVRQRFVNFYRNSALNLICWATEQTSSLSAKLYKCLWIICSRCDEFPTVLEEKRNKLLEFLCVTFFNQTQQLKSVSKIPARINRRRFIHRSLKLSTNLLIEIESSCLFF